MIQRVYIDTSVIGGMFDEEFKFFTSVFFERVFKNEIRLIISDLLEGELVSAPERVRPCWCCAKGRARMHQQVPRVDYTNLNSSIASNNSDKTSRAQIVGEAPTKVGMKQTPTMVKCIKALQNLVVDPSPL